MRRGSAGYRGKWRRGIALLGVSAVALWAPTMGIAPVQAAPSPAASYERADTLGRDQFNRTGTSLGTAPVGGAWATASPTGLFQLQGGAAIWSGFRRGQTTHAWLPEVAALDQQVVASFAFGLISRTHYGMSHRTVVRRQANGDGYRTSASVLSSGRVDLALTRVRSGVVTPLAAVARAARLRSNNVLNVQTRVVGTSPVHVVARAWVEGTPAPAWQIAYADSSANAISSPGAVGINANMGTTGSGRTVRLTRIVSQELLP